MENKKIINMLQRLTSYLIKKDKQEIKNLQLEVYSRLLLTKYLEGINYFPTTKSSLSFNTIRIVINDIIINNRSSIIEFGSGLSTVIIANCIKSLNKKIQFYSVEDNLEWKKIINEYLINAGLTEYVNIIHAPLKKATYADWYDKDVLNSKLLNEKFDIAIIDGPAAYYKAVELSRYESVAFLKEKLMQSYALFLDDANREGEKQIMKFWKQEGFEFNYISEELSFCKKGNNFNIA